MTKISINLLNACLSHCVRENRINDKKTKNPSKEDSEYFDGEYKNRNAIIELWIENECIAGKCTLTKNRYFLNN